MKFFSEKKKKDENLSVFLKRKKRSNLKQSNCTDIYQAQTNNKWKEVALTGEARGASAVRKVNNISTGKGKTKNKGNKGKKEISKLQSSLNASTVTKKDTFPLDVTDVYSIF